MGEIRYQGNEKGGNNDSHLRRLKLAAERVLARVGNVQEAVLVLVLVVDAAHEGGRWRQDFVDEDEDGLLWRQLDPLADHINELAHGEIGWDKILLLVNRRDIALLHLLADDLSAC